MVYGDGEAKDSITWQQARAMTKQIVENSLNHPNACCADYAQRIGIEAEMKQATRDYAEWFVAAEIRVFAKEGVMVRKLTEADRKKYLGRGLPWSTQMVTLGNVSPRERSKTRHGE